MRHLSYLILLITITTLSIGCNQRWREVDSGVPGEDIYDHLASLTEFQNVQMEGSAISISEIDSLLDGGRLYYAGFPSSLSPVIEGIFPIYYPDFFSTVTQPNLEDLEDVYAYFIVKKISSGALDAILVIEFYDRRNPGTQQIRAYRATDYSSIDDTGFVIELESAQTFIQVKSIDPITEDDFSNNIQLEIYDDAGDLRGQISSMEGFKLIL